MQNPRPKIRPGVQVFLAHVPSNNDHPKIVVKGGVPSGNVVAILSRPAGTLCVAEIRVAAFCLAALNGGEDKAAIAVGARRAPAALGRSRRLSVQLQHTEARDDESDGQDDDSEFEHGSSSQSLVNEVSWTRRHSTAPQFTLRLLYCQLPPVRPWHCQQAVVPRN